MTRSLHWRIVASFLLVLPLADLLGGCGDEESELDTIVVRLVDSRDDSPVLDAEVGLFDLVEWRMVRNSRVDARGEARLRPPTTGAYAPVISAPGMQVFALPQSRVDVGQRARELRLTIPMRPTRELTDFGVRLTGRVVDASTGRPIVHAQIEMTSAELQDPNFSELRGDRSASEVVSDENGDFEIDQVPMVQVPGELDLFTTSLRVRAAGYRSAYRLGWARSEIPSTITLALQPGQDDGRITGRVVDLDGLPLAGVSVRAEWRSANQALFRSATSTNPWLEDDESSQRLALPSTDRTQADGRFDLTGLPRGRFHLRAAVDEGDGFWSDAGRNVVLADTAATADMGDLLAMPEVVPSAPLSGAVVDSNLVLSWEDYSGASDYFVSIGRGDGMFANLRSDSTSLRLSDVAGFVEPERWYAWRIFALGSAGEILSGSARAWLFRVEDPGPVATK